jgi:hypothetical protein
MAGDAVMHGHAQMVINVASSSIHLTNSSKRHFGNGECSKLKFRIWISDIQHDVCTNFNEFPSSP